MILSRDESHRPFSINNGFRSLSVTCFWKKTLLMLLHNHMYPWYMWMCNYSSYHITTDIYNDTFHKSPRFHAISWPHKATKYITNCQMKAINPQCIVGNLGNCDFHLIRTPVKRKQPEQIYQTHCHNKLLDSRIAKPVRSNKYWIGSDEHQKEYKASNKVYSWYFSPNFLKYFEVSYCQTTCC